MSVRYCSQCGARVSGARYCGQCGTQVEEDLGWSPQPRSSRPLGGGFKENELGALAYLTPIPALAMLILEPYRRNRFIRFHSYQCLFLTLAAIVLSAILAVAAVLLSVLQVILSILGFLGGLLSGASQVLLLGIWAFAAYRAWQGHEYRLPVIGRMASRHAMGN